MQRLDWMLVLVTGASVAWLIALAAMGDTQALWIWHDLLGVM
jgi:hypothetical protein